MGKKREQLILVVTDCVTLSLGWYAYYLLRVRSGWVDIAAEPDFWAPMVLITLFWQILFWVVGLYRPWYAASRFDELTLIFKTTVMGCLILFFVIFIDDAGVSVGSNVRILILVYGGILLLLVATGRLAVRSIQRRMLIAGMGAHNTLIVGSPARSRELLDQVRKYPALGYRITGFVRIEKPERRRSAQRDRGTRVLGEIGDLSAIISREGIREVLIALDSKDHNRLLDIVSKCNGHRVGLKIVPDLYDIISGQARTNQIYGFPLIEISPQLMAPWEVVVKRAIDVFASSLILLLGLPVWLLIGLLIKLESPGPVLYRQERVGKEGAHFRIIKFRSMRQDAEKGGPRWAEKKDPRVTSIGRILRKLHLDEVPQFLNVFRGQMSLVGPRPERPVFVEELTKEIPLYPRRLRVRPGITGWAQVKLKYDETIDDVKKKVQYDLFYIENISLRMDFKIILSTVFHMLLGKGH